MTEIYIKEWRQHRELSQTQLAEKVDISGGQLSKIESGRFGWTRPTLESIAYALNCAVPDLFYLPPSANIDALYDIIRNAESEAVAQMLRVLQSLQKPVDEPKSSTDDVNHEQK